MNSRWLNALFKEHPEKTKKSLADFLGMEPPAVSKMLNGTRQIKAEEYLSMRTFFGLARDGERALMKGRKIYTIPNDVRDHILSENIDSQEIWADSDDILQQDSNILYQRTMVIENADDHMRPDFKKGQAVLIDLEDQTPEAVDMFVVSDGTNQMVRLCEKIMDGSVAQIRLSANQKDFTAQILNKDEILILGRVIGSVIIR